MSAMSNAVAAFRDATGREPTSVAELAKWKDSVEEFHEDQLRNVRLERQAGNMAEVLFRILHEYELTGRISDGEYFRGWDVLTDAGVCTRVGKEVS